MGAAKLRCFFGARYWRYKRHELYSALRKEHFAYYEAVVLTSPKLLPGERDRQIDRGQRDRYQARMTAYCAVDCAQVTAAFCCGS